jgi:peptidyl-prolyl cis-trans isomerase D
MFIAHGDKVRKNARWIMAIVLILLIPGFIALFTQSGGGRPNDQLPTIAGKPVDAARFTQAMDKVRAQYVISQGRELRRSAEMLNQLKQEAVLQMLMEQEAGKLGLRVSDEELVAQIHALPILVNEAGQFQPERYRQLMIYLNNFGINAAQFEDVLRAQLLQGKLQQLVTAGAKATPLEVQQTYLPLHEKVTIELVRFEVADYQQPVVVSNEMVRAFYESNRESFATPEKMKVRYARFDVASQLPHVTVTEADVAEFYERNKLQYAGTNNVPPALDAVKTAVTADLRRLRAERAAADRAGEFSVRIAQPTGATKPEFAAVCAEFGVTPQVTEYFTRTDPIPGITAGADFAQRAFALSADQPYSDPVAGSNTFYVLEYVDFQPSTIPPFEQVEAAATAEIKRGLTLQATRQQGRELVIKLKALVAAGKSFADARAELNLKVEHPATFSIADERPELPAAAAIQQTAVTMAVGAISPFLPTVSGGLVFRLIQREPPDLAEFEKDRERVTRQVLNRNRQALFNDWLNGLIQSRQVDFKIARAGAPTDDAVH